MISFTGRLLKEKGIITLERHLMRLVKVIRRNIFSLPVMGMNMRQ